MPRKANNERVQCRYFSWLLAHRGGVFYADGRGNTPDVGRHSLGTRDRTLAGAALHRLDLVKAVACGRADRALLSQDERPLLPLAEGWFKYLDYVARPVTQGGASPATIKRYRPVFAKFADFGRERRVEYWQQVTKQVLRDYGRWLNERDYHDKTQYIELTVLKQVLKWLTDERLLPPECHFKLSLKKPAGTRTYCYSPEQVRAMVEFCRADGRLHWLAAVIIALAATGLRIGELAELRWSDLDLDRGLLRLVDRSRLSRHSERGQERTTKSHRDRAFPLHNEIRAVLSALPRRPDNRVFQGPNGGRLKPDTVRNILRRDVLAPLEARYPETADGPGIAAGRLHSFRHYFCSLAADNGVSEQLLMSWLGHRNSELIRHYYHMRDEESRRQMNRLPLLGEPRSAQEPTDG